MPDNRHLILEVIEDHKEKIGDGDYLKLCNLLKENSFIKENMDHLIKENMDHLIRENEELCELITVRNARIDYLEVTSYKLFKRIMHLSKQLGTLQSVKGVGEKIYTSIMEHMNVFDD